MNLRRVAQWAGGCLLVCLILSCGGCQMPAVLTLYASFGWLGFLWRVIPNITVNVSAVASGVACLAAVGIGVHWSLKWLSANLPRSTEPRRPWTGRWTLGVTIGFLVMFASGICVVGAAHQAAWLLTSKEPLLGYSYGDLLYRTQSASNLHNIGLGLATYHDLRRTFPVGATFDMRGRPQHGWQTYLLPFVEQVPLYDRIDRSAPWNALENEWPFRQHPPIYVHPKLGVRNDTNGYSLTGYAGNGLILGGARQWSLPEVADGASKTILSGEATTDPRPWGDPINWRDPSPGIAHTANSFGGPLADVTLFLFADGHASPISNKIDPNVFRALCTPAAHDSIPSSLQAP